MLFAVGSLPDDPLAAAAQFHGDVLPRLLASLAQADGLATLVFAPKIVAIFASLLIFLPLMGALMGAFMRQIAARIAGM